MEITVQCFSPIAQGSPNLALAPQKRGRSGRPGEGPLFDPEGLFSTWRGLFSTWRGLFSTFTPFPHFSPFFPARPRKPVFGPCFGPVSGFSGEVRKRPVSARFGHFFDFPGGLAKLARNGEKT